MKNITQLLVVMMLFHSVIYSQNEVTDSSNNGLEIVNAAGGDAFANEGSVAYSLGTVFYTTLEETELSVAQGVQQPEADQSKDTDEVKIIIFPNPTTESTTIEIPNFDNELIFYQLYDQYGRQLKSNFITSRTTKVIIDYLSSSTYFLTVTVSDKITKSFKILKR